MRFASGGWKLIDCDAMLEAGQAVVSDDVCVTPVYCPPELAGLFAGESEGATIALPATAHCWSLGM
eukprot:5333546-Prymnesium_polylepis.1